MGIEIKKFVPEVVATGCVNSFGTAVPCFIDGEARKRRSADEAPAATVALVHPYAYAGYAHPGYAYPGYAHAGYAYPYVAPQVLEPKSWVPKLGGQHMDMPIPDMLMLAM